MLADGLVVAEAPEIACTFVPRRNDEVPIDDDDAGLQAAEHGFEECIRLVQLEAALVDLVVHRLQLFVRRLQLLVHRLQLFVCRLELLVRRLELFVRRLELFVRRLQLLHRRLQLLVCGLHVPLGLLERELQPPVARDLAEGDAGADRGAGGGGQRRDLDVDVAHVVSVSPFDVAQGDDVPVGINLLDARAQLHWTE